MDEQGKIISSCDVDSNLALQIWTRGKTPRLSVLNKNKNSRKLIHLSWIEKRDRTLSINGKKPGENISYTAGNFEPAIQKILADFYAKTNFKLKYLKLVIDLEKALHHPEPVSNPSEFALMSEDKRSSLWVADCSQGDRKSGVFRPFFLVTKSEAAVLSEEKLKISSITARGIDSLMKTGVINELKKINPERWHNTIRVTAAAMLLGFSYCGSDGSKMADSLWLAGEKPKNLNPNVIVQKIPEKKIALNDPALVKLGQKLTAFVRHYYMFNKIKISYESDSEKNLQEAGFERSRRIDFNAGTLGDVPYRVTFYENSEQGITAFNCNPRMATARHTGDMLIKIPTEIYKAALKANTMGGSEDDFFTISRLLWARQFGEWYLNLKPFVKKFAGLIDLNQGEKKS